MFVLTRPEVKPFTAKQIELVETFADQAVIAIENVRLFDEVQARNREVSEALEQQTATGAILRVIAASPTDIQPVLQVVAESAARFCDTHDAVIFLADEGDLVVKAHYGPVPLDFASLPIGDGTLAGRAYAERKTRYVDDLLTGGDEFPHAKAMALRYGHRSIAATPLMRDEEAIGVIVMPTLRDAVRSAKSRSSSSGPSQIRPSSPSRMYGCSTKSVPRHASWRGRLRICGPRRTG